jgi:hypothetical protein
MADTPNTPVTAARFKRLLAKAKDEGLALTFREVIWPIATETVKRLLWGQ